MKRFNKQILEAVNRGIKLALDDYEDVEQNSSISPNKDIINNDDVIRHKIDLMKEVVDLGLPSGTLWCKYNLGVNPNKLSNPEDWYGDYYAWGELKPNKTFRDFIYFYCDNYKWYDKQLTTYTKYNKQDNLTQLLPEDDAAYQNKKLGNYKFHIPTKEQCKELLKYTENYWVKNYNPNKLDHNPKDDKGVQDLNGILFISKINNAELFIPDANYHDIENYGHDKNSHLGKKRYDCAFWTACQSYSQAFACIFYVDYDNMLYGGTTVKNRWAGLPIHPVLNL